MCVETMDIKPKHMKPDCLRKTAKPGSKLRWRLLRVHTEEDGALQQASLTIRKYLRREQKRAQLAKLSQIIPGTAGKERREPMYEQRPAEACAQRHPAGAMAPGNTTQYLMSNVYEDMKTDIQAIPHDASAAALYGECLSPSSLYAALDRGYERCLDFQQRDFERLFDSSRPE